jgi:hypothetical protein
MAIAVLTLTLTDEEGQQTVHPVRRSVILQFERRVKRPFNSESAMDSAVMAFRVCQERWPASDEELDNWVDSYVIEVTEVPSPTAATEDPTVPVPVPNS